MPQVNIVNLGKRIEIAPGQKIAPLQDMPPQYGVFRLIPIGGNEYKAQIEVRMPWIRLTPAIPKELGLGIEYRSLKRLIAAGFVVGQKVTPGTWQFSLQSYYDHLERVRLDPEFWDETNPARNLQKFKAASVF